MNMDNNEDFIGVEEESSCPFVDEIMDAVCFPKPFGLIWEEDVIIDFLKKLGYKIIDGQIAVKPGDKEVPDNYNLDEVFNYEVQKILATWLLKLSGKS